MAKALSLIVRFTLDYVGHLEFDVSYEHEIYDGYRNGERMTEAERRMWIGVIGEDVIWEMYDQEKSRRPCDLTLAKRQAELELEGA